MDHSITPLSVALESVDNYAKEVANLRSRVESLERQREHLEQENRRLALDLCRATARISAPQPAVAFTESQADDIIQALERAHATLDRLGVPR